MKAVGFHEPGGPDVLEVLDVPTPEAGPGEVRIRVHAASVNPADTLIRVGDVNLARMRRPYVAGMEVAGLVDQVGPGVGDRLDIGDRVMSLVLPTRPLGGGQAEWVVVPAEWAVHVSPSLSLFEAATIPMNGLTAVRAIQVLHLAEGSTAAVTGSAGAFGSYFIQLCTLAGIRVIADSAEADEPLIRSFGPDMIARRGAGYVADVRRHVPYGVDALADGALLGAAALDAIADHGLYASLRAIGERGTRALPDPPPRGISYRRLNFFDNPDIPAGLQRLADAAAARRLTPRVGEVIAPSDAGRAHLAIEKGGVRGRFVIDFTQT